MVSETADRRYENEYHPRGCDKSYSQKAKAVVFRFNEQVFADADSGFIWSMDYFKNLFCGEKVRRDEDNKL